MEPLLGEIRAVGFNYAPKGWAICDGSLIQIRANTALFSILGLQYGGDGRTTFGLPDLRGRAIVNAGQGPGLSNYPIGMMTGSESVTLSSDQLPAHIHTLEGSVAVNPNPGNSDSPAGNYPSYDPTAQYGETASTSTMAANSVSGTGSATGGNQAHENRQPFLAMNYIIAVQGIYPSRP